MIGVRVIRVSSLCIPSRCLLPALAAVCRQVQIHPAAQNVIRILRMHRYGISVGNLCFAREMFPPDFSPAYPAIVAPKNPKHQIAPEAVGIFARAYITSGFDKLIAKLVKTKHSSQQTFR